MMTTIPATKVVIFPDEGAAARPGLLRICEAVRFRFGSGVPLLIAVDDALAAQARDAGMEPIAPDAAAALEAADAWVIASSFLPVFQGEGGFEKIQLPGNKATRAGKRLFLLEPDGFLHPLQVNSDGSLDAPCTPEHDPHLERNVFVRMGSRNFRGAAYFFPFNGFYVGHPSAFGPIDEFGFRNAHDRAALERRAPDHLLVAVFGGSTAWSPCCLQHETFASVLERRLEEALRQRGGSRKVSVLNFGVSGHTVVNEMITYLLFCHRLKPEIVIAHDVFNDLANGVQTDPELLNRCDLTYMAAMEQWAQQLMGASHVPLTQPTDRKRPLRLANNPQTIVHSYLTRKQQFCDVVERNSSVFVWGTQPAWFAKPAAAEEAKRFAKIRALSPRLDPMYRALPQLYDMTRATIGNSKIRYAVDVHGTFQRLTEADDVFIDHAHLNPTGETIIADVYCDVILARVLPDLKQMESS